VPAQVAGLVRANGHAAWTAFEANLQEAPDEALITYAYAKNAILVTNNKDCAELARRHRTARVVYLRVQEDRAEEAMSRALEWLRTSHLSSGRVLRVPMKARICVMAPLPW
jgi:predicted nuclease of predicted toxin-antitoxin system